jgi:hypothetical protein
MTAQARYRLYIDESGDHTFNQVDRPEHRYLGLMGIWFEQGKPYEDFADGLEQLRRSVFGYRPDEPAICLHRKDIVQRKGAFGRLLNPEIGRLFDKQLITWVQNARFLMTCVVLDKKEHHNKSYRSLFHPYHYCLAVLLERYAGWLEQMNVRGDVMAESRGRSEDEQLQDAFERTYKNGTRFHSGHRFQRTLTSKKLKLKKKQHDIPGLQLADLLAHPGKREVIAESRHRSRPSNDFGARLLEAARTKFNHHLYTKRVQGYGKILLK